MQFRRCQNKHHVCRRFFQCFQECVKRASTQHMDLVHNINTIFQRGRRIDHLVSDIADIIHAVVGGGVHFQYVSRRSRVNGKAGRATIARTSVYGRLTVYRFGKDFGAGRFSRSARAAKQIGVRKFMILGFILQNRSNMLLPTNLVKGSGTPFSIECLMHFPPHLPFFWLKNRLQSKTIHLKIESRLYAIFAPPAPNRLPRGTSS